jgi:hypothetical protein
LRWQVIRLRNIDWTCRDPPDGTIEQYRRLNDRRKPALVMITDLLNRFPVNADDSIPIETRRAILRPRMPQACRLPLFRSTGGFCEATLAFEHRAMLELLKIPHAAYWFA